MSATDGYLQKNAAYAEQFTGPLPLPPSAHLAVVACMDARLNVYAILGLGDGEAHVIRTRTRSAASSSTWRPARSTRSSNPRLRATLLWSMVRVCTPAGSVTLAVTMVQSCHRRCLARRPLRTGSSWRSWRCAAGVGTGNSDRAADHSNSHRPHRPLQQNPRPHPPAIGTNIRVLRQDRLGGLIHEYIQVAGGDRVSGTHRLMGR
jgi:hypothetical protein